MNSPKELTNIEIKLNRLRSQKAALGTKLKRQNNALRKARTRTLIQIGGLVDLTPLLAVCDINLGDDLQLDHPDKAAALLGILAEFSEKLPHPSEENISHFREKGLRILKQLY